MKKRVYRPKVKKVKETLFRCFCARCSRLLGIGRSQRRLGFDKCQGCVVRKAMEALALNPNPNPPRVPRSLSEGTLSLGAKARQGKGLGKRKGAKRELLNGLERLVSEL